MIRRFGIESLIPAILLTAAAAFGQTTLGDTTYFQDVLPAGTPASGYFTWVQLAKRIGIAVPSALGPCTNLGGTTPIVQPPGPGGTVNPNQLVCPYFGPDTVVTRAEMAWWIVRGQLDETQVSNYLCATGGDPSGVAFCGGGFTASSFGDVGTAGSAIVNPFLPPNPALGIGGVTNAQLMRDIEVMVRRGYTKGCTGTNDPIFRYCPNDPVTRAEMAVFIIRAKMNNVFPTTLSGIPLITPYGDNFATVPKPYFTDVQPNDPVYGSYYLYIQKMRELGITQGTSATTFSPGNNVTRKEIAVFIVRAFFL